MIKCSEYLTQTIHNSPLSALGDRLDIICAIQNKYFRLATSDLEGRKQMVETMKYLLDAPNPLKEFPETNLSLNWKNFDTYHCIFAMLVEQDVRGVTFGECCNIFVIWVYLS